MNKIKVVFIISSFNASNTGVGGHYRSVKSFAEELGKYHEVSVFTVGDLPSPVFENRAYYEHIGFNKKSFLKSFCKLKSRFFFKSKEKVVVVSVGGSWSHIFGLYAKLVNKHAALVYVKPGGDVLKKDFFIYDKVPVVVFSPKDKSIFINSDPNRLVRLNPARISSLVKKSEIAKMVEEKIINHFGGVRNPILLIISRLSDDKLNHLRLILGSLTSKELGLNIVVVGQVTSGLVLEEVERYLKKTNGLLISDSEITKDAAQALFSANYFCGIGRSALEAVSLGIPTFIPIRMSGAECLVMLNEKNWQFFLKENFTHRACLEGLSKDDLLMLDVGYADNKEVFLLAERMRFVFEKNLSVKSSVSIWDEVFIQADKDNNINKINIFIIYFRIALGSMVNKFLGKLGLS